MRGTRKGARGASQRSTRQTEASYDQRLHAAAPVDKRTRLAGGVKPLSGGGGIFKSAAVGVLRIERKLMTTGEITKVALERGLIKCQGKTPEATMASALYTDVKRKHDKSVFTRPQEGLFGLREWINEGFFPEGWVGPIDGLGLAPFKKRNSLHVKTTRSTSGRSTRARASQSNREASSDFDEDPADCDTMDDEELIDEEETEDLPAEEEEEDEESPKQRSASQWRGRSRASGGGGAGGSRTTTTRSHEVPSSGQEPDEAQEALESPLHMLGEVAEMTQEPDGAGSGQTGPSESGSKRRRRPSSIQVPEGALGTSAGAEEPLMPKSPFDDSLAALHEIATSPSTYAPSAMGMSCMGEGGAYKRRSRHSLGLGDLITSRGRQSALPSPASLFHGLDSGSMPLLPDHGAVLLSGPDTSKVPLLNLNIQSLAGSHLLDTQGLLPLPLPDTLPTTPDMLAAAMNSAGLGSLISPQALGSGWGPHAADLGSRLFRLPGRSESEGSLASLLQMSNASFGQGIMHHSPFLPAPAPALAPGRAAPAPSREYGGLSQQQVNEELVEIAKLRVVAERLEARMGRSNLQVGKAWLSLARMCQHVGGSEPAAKVHAAEALTRAQAVCRHFAAEQHISIPLPFVESFEYLAAQLKGAGCSGQGAEAERRGNGNGNGADPRPTAATGSGQEVITNGALDLSRQVTKQAAVAKEGGASETEAGRPGGLPKALTLDLQAPSGPSAPAQPAALTLTAA